MGARKTPVRWCTSLRALGAWEGGGMRVGAALGAVVKTSYGMGHGTQ